MSTIKNILIVDDDMVNHFIGEQLVKSFSPTSVIYKALNGKEAIHILKACCSGLREKLDIILLDLHMPVMNGFEFLKAFQELECHYKQHISIAFVSSSCDPDDAGKALSMGVRYFFHKPLTRENLELMLDLRCET